MQCGLEALTIDAGTVRCKSYTGMPCSLVTFIELVPPFSELVCEIRQFGIVSVLMGITGTK